MALRARDVAARRYSVTFSQLRDARIQHRRQQNQPGGETDPWGPPLDDTVVLILHTWTYAGRGYGSARGPDLALASAALAREHDGQADDAN